MSQNKGGMDGLILVYSKGSPHSLKQHSFYLPLTPILSASQILDLKEPRSL